MAHHLTAIFVFLLATLAATSFGAPVEGSTFSHSCGRGFISESNTGGHKVRHSLANITDTVQRQLELAIKHFETQRETIDDYFKKVTQFKHASYNYSWLPQKPLDWYKKNMCSLQKGDRVKKAFKAFNSSLQIFSNTFEVLKNNSPKIDATIRNDIINNTDIQLTQVRCEVEWALMCLNETTNETEVEDFLSKTMNWDPHPDTTGSLLRDWGVILLFEEFLKDWKVIVSSFEKKPARKIRGNKRNLCKKRSNKKKKKTTDTRKKP